MKLFLAILPCLLIACSTQPPKKPVNRATNMWIERSLAPKKEFDVAWFNGTWRVCETGSNCPKTTNKTTVKTAILQTLPSGNSSVARRERASVNFDFDSSEPKNLTDLERFIYTINTHERLLIVGYTDSLGEEDYNVLLANRRAARVAAWLKKLGIRNPVEIEARGSCCYLASNDTERGRALNRRVIVEIVHED